MSSLAQSQRQQQEQTQSSTTSAPTMSPVSNAAMAADLGASSYTVAAGDSLEGLAELGTGDASRYVELNLANGRSPSDRTLVPGETLSIPSEWDHGALSSGATTASSTDASHALAKALDAGTELAKDIAVNHEEEVSLGSYGDLTVGVVFEAGYQLAPTPAIRPKKGSISVNLSDELTEELGGVGGSIGFDVEAPYLLSEAGFDLPGISASLESTEEGASGSAKVGIDACHALFSVGKADESGDRPVGVGVGFDPIALLFGKAMDEGFAQLDKELGLELTVAAPFEFQADISEAGMKLESAKAGFEASGRFAPGKKKEGEEQDGLKFGVEASVETDYGDMDPEKADFTEVEMKAELYVAVVLGGTEYKLPIVDWSEASKMSFWEEVATVNYWQSCSLQAALEEVERERRNDDLRPTAANRSRLGRKVNGRTQRLATEALAQVEAQAGRKLTPWNLGEMYTCNANGAYFSGSGTLLRQALERSGAAESLHDFLCGKVTVADVDGSWSSTDEEFGTANVESSDDGLVDISWSNGSAFGDFDGSSFSGTFRDERFGEGRAHFEVQQGGDRLHLVLTTGTHEWTIDLQR